MQAKNRAFYQFTKKTTLAIILLVALVIRLLGITTRPIWYDEAFAVLFSEKGIAAMLAGTLSPNVQGIAADIHPLAYYTLLYEWMKIFGESLASVRILSILLGMGTVLLTYYLMRAMFKETRLAFLGALGVALSPFQVHYSQEIRMYALLALALTGATVAFWQGLHTNRRFWWVLFAVCAALAQYTQNLAAFYLVPLAMTPIFMRRWDKVKLTILAGAGALLLYLPWLVQIPAQFAIIQAAYWVDRPTITSLFTTMLAYVTNLPVDGHWLPSALAVTVLVIALAAYQTWLAFRRKLPGAGKGLWLAYLAFAPAVLMFIFSQWQPVYIERGLLPSGVMFWLWLAWVLMATGLPHFLRILNFLLLIIVISFGLATHLTYAGFPYGPYQSLDASLEARFQPGDVIIHSNKLSMLPALYFDRSLKQSFIADPAGGSTDTLAPATQQVLGIQASPSLETAVGNANRIWFIIFKQSIDEATQAGLAAHPQITWLNEHFRLISMETWGPLLVYVYTH